MAQLFVTTREGDTIAMQSKSNCSLMELIRDNGIDELLALCGGSCSCATCHVYIDPEQASLLPPVSEDEDALLDASEHRNAQSRLSCQIPVTEKLDGLRVTIAPED